MLRIPVGITVITPNRFAVTTAPPSCDMRIIIPMDFGHMGRRKGPIISALVLLKVLDINIIEALAPSCKAATLEIDRSLTKTALESRLSVPSKSILTH